MVLVVTVGWGSGTTLVCTFVTVWEVSEEGARRPGDGSERVKLHTWWVLVVRWEISAFDPHDSAYLYVGVGNRETGRFHE
jgi:hypothetical protein